MEVSEMVTGKKHVLVVILCCIALLVCMTAAGCGLGPGKKDGGDSPSGENPIIITEEAGQEDGRESEQEAIETGEAQTLAPEEDGDADVESILQEMSLEDKAAQLFIVLPESITGVDLVTAAGELTRDAINDRPVGGFIYMTGNLENADQTSEMLAGVQQFSMERIGLPMFTCVDEEGGTVARIANNDGFDVPRVGDMSDVGASGDSGLAYEKGQTVGTYLTELGFNVDFAPDADVLGYDGYELLMYRSFGTDPYLVSDMASAFRNGLEETGIRAVYKHFPGHGAASGDSHEGYVQVEKTMDELKGWDLIPFRGGIEDGLGWIMVGHITLPNATQDGLPASLSKEVVTGLLREEMGYDGIVITDAMNMGAIAENYSSADAAVLALQAGVDLILVPADFESAYQGVLDAVRDGRLSEERINESMRRILHAKLELPQMVSP